MPDARESRPARPGRSPVGGRDAGSRSSASDPGRSTIRSRGSRRIIPRPISRRPGPPWEAPDPRPATSACWKNSPQELGGTGQALPPEPRHPLLQGQMALQAQHVRRDRTCRGPPLRGSMSSIAADGPHGGLEAIGRWRRTSSRATGTAAMAPRAHELDAVAVGTDDRRGPAALGRRGQVRPARRAPRPPTDRRCCG